MQNGSMLDSRQLAIGSVRHIMRVSGNEFRPINNMSYVAVLTMQMFSYYCDAVRCGALTIINCEESHEVSPLLHWNVGCIVIHKLRDHIMCRSFRTSSAERCKSCPSDVSLPFCALPLGIFSNHTGLEKLRFGG